MFYAYPLLETGGVFLDISKAFARFGMKAYDIIKTYGKNGSSLIKKFSTNRIQRLALNGEISNWKEVLAGVPLGSILYIFSYIH